MLFQELFTEETSILRHILDQEAKHQNASCKFDEDIEYEIRWVTFAMQIQIQLAKNEVRDDFSRQAIQELQKIKTYKQKTNKNRITTLQSLLEFDWPCARQNTAQLLNIPSGTT